MRSKSKTGAWRFIAGFCASVFLVAFISCRETGTRNKEKPVESSAGRAEEEPVARVPRFDIVADHKPRTAIVIPDKPLQIVSYAAEELQYHVEKATGARLDIFRESKRPQQYKGLIFLGTCSQTKQENIDSEQLPGNGFIIKLTNGNLFLAGKDSQGYYLLKTTWAGTLFAVYEFLEKEMGVLWLWPGELGEVIPRRADIRIGDWDQLTRPRFISADLNVGSFIRKQKTGWSSDENRNRFFKDQRVWLRRHRGRKSRTLRTGHAFRRYWKRFGKSHPEFFNLLPNGKREPPPNRPEAAITMCVSEPGLWQQIIDDWKEARKKHPGINVNACENDNPGVCTCPRCRAWDGPDPRFKTAGDILPTFGNIHTGRMPSLSDRYARFYLAVQREAQKVEPDAVVFAYAYANYREPPRQTKLNENIIIGFVPRYYFPWTAEKLAQARQDWSGWRKTGARLFYRPNYMLIGHNMPIFVARKLGGEFSFVAKNGLIGTHFDSLTGQYATQGPNLYVLARVHVRPEWPVEKILDEYYCAFGKAEDAVREYFGHWEKVSDAVTDDLMDRYKNEEDAGWNRWYLVALHIFTPPVMAKGRALLEKAKAASGGDTIAESRVAFLEKGFRNAELTLVTQRAYKKYLASTRDIHTQRKYHASIRDLYNYRKSIEAEGVCNMGFLAFCEARRWDIAVAFQKEPGELLSRLWKFKWDQENVGERQGWQEKEFDDSKWSEIEIGAPWEKRPLGKKWKEKHGQDYNGFAWYRTTFAVKNPAPSAKRIQLLFGAIDESATIWVNGTLVLVRVYDKKVNPNSWQEPFFVDITKVVRFDKPNVLAVRVEDNAGEGGITKPVWLQVSDPPVSEGNNPIANPGFEDSGKPWKFVVSKGKYTFSIDNTVAHNEKNSARIVCIEAGRVQFSQFQVPVKEGQNYKLGAWIRTSADFAGRITIAAAVKGSITKKASTFNNAGIWTEVVIKDIKATFSQMAPYFVISGGTGTVWIDDVDLVEVK